MASLEKSDSSIHLSKLNTENPVCYFCQNEYSYEEGMLLVDATQFLDCRCHILTHYKCWGEYLQKIEEPHIGCPLCNIPLAGWRKRISTHEVQELANHKKYGMYYGIVFLCVILSTLVIGFGIGFSIQH